MSRQFIGRAEALAALETARRNLAQSRGSAVLLSGETGIGKSRLLARFIERSRDTPTLRNIVVAECLEQAPEPFGPIRTVVGALAQGLAPGTLPASAARAVAQITRAGKAEGALPPAETMERSELLAALTEFLKAVAVKRATIVAIEDLHWADRSTIDFLAYAIPRVAGSRMLLLATFRSEAQENDEGFLLPAARLLRHANVRLITLEALSTDELYQLIDASVEPETQIPAHVKHDIVTRSEGNPFFAEELLKSALEARDHRSAAHLPLSIRASIAQRLTLVPADERRILERAAVLGYRFDPALLALVTGSDLDAILPALRRARNNNIVVEEDQADVRYRFRHALTRQTIYESMLALDRRRLHGQILAALESLAQPERYIDALAYHAWEARESAKACAYNERAGAAALDQRALAEATACFQRALEFANSERDMARLTERVGYAAQLQGELTLAAENYESAIVRYVNSGDASEAARILAALIALCSNLGNHAAGARGEEFLAEHGADVDARYRERLLAVSAKVAAARFDFDTADRLIARLGDSPVLDPPARLNYVGTLLERHFFFGEVEAWQRLLASFEEATDQLANYSRAGALYTLAQRATYMCANDFAERAFSQARHLVREGGYSAIDIFGAAARAHYFYQRGRLPEARAALDATFGRPDVGASSKIAADVAISLAWALGENDLVARFAPPRLVESARRSADVDDALLLGSYARRLAVHGEIGQAQADLRLALSRVPSAIGTTIPLLVTAARYLDAGELESLVALARTGARSDANVAGHAGYALVCAVAAMRCGRRVEAIAQARRAADLAARLDWPMFEAEARELSGESARALEVYRRCEATAQIARLAAFERRDEPASRLLSERELEIARLVAHGFTNKVISERLAIGQKTVEKHLASVFRKLGARSRSAVAAWVVDAEGATKPAAG
jgi:predicted ATPase/DNA-binding NarL/FixJ family response regulator